MFLLFYFFFFFNDPPTTEIYTLSLHDALPILTMWQWLEPEIESVRRRVAADFGCDHEELAITRSEEHTSELQSRLHLVCRLLLEKKKKKSKDRTSSSCYKRSACSCNRGSVAEL